MEAHIATLLPTQNRVVGADTNTTFLAHYDLNEYDVIRNVKTVGERNAMYFNGSSMVECPSLNTSGLTGFSTEAWIYWDGSTGEKIVYCQENIAEMKIDGGCIYIAWSPHWAWVGNTSTTISANTWNHVAAVYDGANQYIYLNGTQIYTVALTGSMSGNTNPFRIGARGTLGSAPSTPFTGKIHNVRVWFRALSATDIQNNMTVPPVTEATQLMGWWKMNEGQGVTAPDYSPYHNDGRIQGATWTTGNSVFTLRPKEGYFGGSAMAVEESTTNLMTNPTFTSNTNSWSNGSWDIAQWIGEYNPMTGTNGCIRLADTSATTGFLSQNPSNVTFPLTLTTYFKIVTGDPTKIRTGGVVFYTDNTYDDYTWESTGNLTYIGNGIYKVTKTITSTNSSKTFSYYQFRVSHMDSAASEIWVYACQAENKGFSTSFVNGSRGVTSLAYPSTNVLNPQAGTISMWVNFTNIPITSTGWRMLFVVKDNGWADGTETNQISFRLYNSWNALRVTMGGASSTGSITTTIPSEGWHMVTVTWDTTAQLITFYVDGSSVGTLSGTAYIPTQFNNYFWLGRWTNNSGDNYNANNLIDELRIDNIARTDSEIQAWYYCASPFWPRGTYRKPL